MSAPRHITPVAISVGPEGAKATVDVATPSNEKKVVNPITRAVEGVKDRLRNEGPAEYQLRSGRFGDIEDRVVHVGRKEKNAVAEILSKWVLLCVDGRGMRNDVGELDKIMVSLYSTMAGLPKDQRLTSNLIQDRDNPIGPDDLDFNHLNPDQVEQLMDVMKSAEIYMSAVIGMEINPMDHVVDNTATGIRKRFHQYAKEGADFIIGAGDGLSNLPARTLAIFDKRMKDAQHHQKLQAEINQHFKSTAFTREIGSAGLKLFKDLITVQKDPVLGLKEQRERLLQIRSTRIKMIDQLSRKKAHPDAARIDVRERAMQLVDQRSDLSEFRGLNYESIPRSTRDILEAEARLQLATEKATDRAEEIHEKHQMELFSQDNIKTLQEKIDRLKGKGAANPQEVDQAKTEFERREQAWTDKGTEITNWKSEIAEIDANLLIYTPNLAILIKRENDITNGTIKYPTDQAGAQQRLADLSQVRKNIEDAQKKITDANTRKGELQRKNNTADTELTSLDAQQKEAKKKWDELKGTDEEIRKLLEAINEIVKNDGTRNDMSWAFVNPDSTPTAIFTECTSASISAANYDDFRENCGLKGKVFDELVGKNNRNLRICLARIMHIQVDRTRLSNKVYQLELDKQIWEILRSQGNSKMVSRAEWIWKTMLDTASLKSKPTLDPDWDDNYYAGSETDIPRAAKYESQPVGSRESMETVLLEKQGLIAGVNSAIEYVTLSGGQTVSVIVDKKGRNLIIDQKGEPIGSMERVKIVGGVRQIDNATTETAERIQGEIFISLAAKRIRDNLMQMVQPNHYLAVLSNGVMFPLIKEDGVLKVIISGGANQDINEYLMENPTIAKDEGLQYLHKFERRGGMIVNRSKNVSGWSEMRQDADGTMIFEWKDEPTDAPTSRYYDSADIILGDGNDINFVVHQVSKRPIPHITNSFARQNIEAALAGSRYRQRGRILEGGFYYLAYTSKERRKAIRDYTPNVSVSLAGGKIYEIGIDVNGGFILWDKTDSTELNPPNHRALNFLNDEFIAGRISSRDFNKIRRAIGRNYLIAENQQILNS